jgi:tRNA-2-methylthio-N6-dimethylallyladenosine synthase
MNVHDSERIAGLLDAAGYVPAQPAATPDVVVFNTCAVRENADNRLYGNLGHLKPVKDATPGMQIAVGGCLAQKDQGLIATRAPWVDVVFGTHNVGALPVLLERARVEQAAQVELLESLEVFPSTLPARRESTYSAWVSISVGCDNTCTFCIVPSLRGKEEDRRPGDVLREVEVLAAQGVLEVTLLGQNVNSYGRSFGERDAFGRLLRAVGALDGIERVRFTSPHPRDFTDDVIAAMAETPAVCPSLHMPLQSGSDDVLRRMRRSYRSERFLGILDRVRAAMPDAAITTDVIVGFPGETEADFAETLRVVEQSRFAGAFTFQYSKRPGTPAADLPDQQPKQVVQERYERLVALQDRISYEGMQAQVGRTVEVLVSQGEGRKDTAERLTGEPATTGSCTCPRRPACDPATSSPRSSRRPGPTTWSPTGRCCHTAGPLPATPGRAAGPPAPRASRWACPAWGRRRRSRRSPPADSAPARRGPLPSQEGSSRCRLRPSPRRGGADARRSLACPFRTTPLLHAGPRRPSSRRSTP